MRRKSLKRKISNIALVGVLLAILFGIFYNILNSRAENLIEIGATALDSYGYLDDEEFTLEAQKIANDLWEIELPEDVNSKKVNKVLNVTLEKIEVTPVSYKLYVKNDEGWNKIWSKDGIVEMDEEYNTIKDKEGNIPILEMVTNTEELDRRLDEIEEKKIYGDKIIRSFLLTSAFFLDENGQNLNDGGGCRLEDEKDPAYGIIDGNWYAGSTYEQICNLHKMRFAGQIVDISGCDYQEVVTVEE